MRHVEEKVFFPAGTLLPLQKKIKPPEKTKPKKILIIGGPTACGKTSLSLMLARMLKGEIISADSMQVYRGMNIGTAKVSEEDRAQIVHHLIDIRDIHEPFNVVDFYYEARTACDSILARDRVPIVVGGSGFYLRTFIYGPPPGPPSVPDVRESLREEMEKRGPEALYEKLKQLDPDYAATITPYDRHKIVRALEIITLTGEPVSKFSWNHDTPLPDFAFHPWFIYRPRPLLYPAIDARCQRMVEAGLIDEVKELEKQGLSQNLSASQAIGYRQSLEFLQTAQAQEDYENFLKEYKAASRHYAKKQFTWCRKEFLFRWLNVDTHDFEIAAEMIANEFQAAA